MRGMQKRLIAVLSASLVAAALGACSQSDASLDVSAHSAEVTEWRETRLANLLQPTGYLTQIGLYWLEPGTYSFGSDATNDIVFAGDAASNIGEFIVGENGVSMIVRKGVDVRSDQQLVEDMLIAADTSELPIMVTHRSLAWTVVERQGLYGVRLRDFEHPFVASFGPLPYFDIDPSLRVKAILRRYPEPIITSTKTVIEGLDYRPESPGLVEFKIDGKVYELEAYSSGDQLFYVFGDQTNRDSSYGAGRFLYSEVPGEDGLTILDFNKAYSPPCAFNDFSTCPVASPRNRLPIRIEAGEKFDASLHFSAES